MIVTALDMHGLDDYVHYVHVYVSIYYKINTVYTVYRICINSDSAWLYVHVKRRILNTKNFIYNSSKWMFWCYRVTDSVWPI